MPHVIEPAAGADRATLAFLVDAYDEEDGRGRDADACCACTRASRRSRSRSCRCCARTASPSWRARSTTRCAATLQCEYDEGGSIGRRYRRQDEIGTPWCVTIDHESVASAR